MIQVRTWTTGQNGYILVRSLSVFQYHKKSILLQIQVFKSESCPVIFPNCNLLR